ncbi:helix-turn-helix transcriptional regulator [Pelagerythrobacter sp.]|uniref:S24 family peptidase n=1 Tax=Pelagerythrobacter sp. TaxID=2800702 RepID=UPI0035B4AF98
MVKPADTDPRARLLALSRERKVSLASLSELIGRNAAYLQQFVGRGSPRKLEEGDRRTLAEFFGVGEIELGGPARSAAHPERSDGYVTIPRLPLDVSAGPGSFEAQEIPFDSFRFRSNWLREMGLEGADLSAIRVEGDSMEPVLHSGDEIFVDRNRRGLEGIHVVRVDGVLHVKRLHATALGRITLVSENRAYPDVELAREDVEIIGRVVWKSGRV